MGGRGPCRSSVKTRFPPPTPAAMPPLDLSRPGHAPHPASTGQYCPQTYGLGGGQRLTTRTRAGLARATAALLAARTSAPGAVPVLPANRRPPG